MGFWGKAESVAVDGVAGVAGLVEAAGIPGISEAAGAVAVGVHAADSIGHSVASIYDSATGDDAGAEKQLDVAEGQLGDAAVAGVGMVAEAVMPATPVAAIGAGISAGGAATDLMHTGGVLAGGDETNTVPTAGDAIVGLGKAAWNAL